MARELQAVQPWAVAASAAASSSFAVAAAASRSLRFRSRERLLDFPRLQAAWPGAGAVPTPPAPVITPNGGTFDQPLTVTITPAVSTVLGNTPGWRTGVKYPGQGIETVEALSQDGTTVGAMRGRTMANSLSI